MSKPHEPQYISCREACKRLACARGHILKLAERGHISVRFLPMDVAKPRYSAADVERIRRQYTVPSRHQSMIAE
jgi:hypothetical protein